jgi:hypothetical protein
MNTARVLNKQPVTERRDNFLLKITPFLTATPVQNTLEANLVHLADETVDVLLTVTSVTTLDEVLELAGAETASG